MILDLQLQYLITLGLIPRSSASIFFATDLQIKKDF